MKVPLKIVTKQISSSLNASSRNGTYLRGLTTVKRKKKENYQICEDMFKAEK